MKLVMIKMELSIPEKQEFSVDKASLLHGVLMEWLDTEYVEKLHGNGPNPYAQYPEKVNGKWYWNICIFEEEACQQIVPRILEKNQLFLKHNKLEIPITKKQITETVLEENETEKTLSKIKIRFKTPTAFKQKGKYVNRPDIRCILQSMMLKYEAVTTKTGAIDQQLLEELTGKTYVIQELSQNCRFRLEGVQIPAFTGELTLGFQCDCEKRRYLRKLFEFACYCGIGIKTSIGMGAVEIIRNE